VIRTETEWVELIAHGSACLSFETGTAMREKFSAALSGEQREFPLLFWRWKSIRVHL